MSIRELYLRIAGARGHWQLIGTPVQIADALEERFLQGGADGFNVMPPTVPGNPFLILTVILDEFSKFPDILTLFSINKYSAVLVGLKLIYLANSCSFTG